MAETKEWVEKELEDIASKAQKHMNKKKKTNASFQEEYVENWYALAAAILGEYREDVPKLDKNGNEIFKMMPVLDEKGKPMKDSNGKTVMTLQKELLHKKGDPLYNSSDDALHAMGINRINNTNGNDDGYVPEA